MANEIIRFSWFFETKALAENALVEFSEAADREIRDDEEDEGHPIFGMVPWCGEPEGDPQIQQIEILGKEMEVVATAWQLLVERWT